MWAHESMTRCETVLYVDDVQWTYSNNACWRFGPVKLHDSWLSPSSNYVGLDNIPLDYKLYTMPFICHVIPGPVQQCLPPVHLWCDERICSFAVVAMPVEISKCIAVTLVLPGEVRHDPLCRRLWLIKDVFEEVGHQYLAYTILSSHSSHFSCMLVFSMIVFWTLQNVDSVAWSPVWQGSKITCFLHIFTFLSPCNPSVYLGALLLYRFNMWADLTNSTQNLLSLWYSGLNVLW